MSIYASTYISGLSQPVETWLKEQYSDVQIINNYDGLILYKTNLPFVHTPFFNNSFLHLYSLSTIGLGGGATSRHIASLCESCRY